MHRLGAEKNFDLGIFIIGCTSAFERVAQALSDYCQSDVDALVALLPFIIDNLHIQQSLLRGRYMKAVAMMENYGIPMM